MQLPGFGEMVDELRNGSDFIGLFPARSSEPASNGRSLHSRCIGAKRVQGLESLAVVVGAVETSSLSKDDGNQVVRSGHRLWIEVSKQRPNITGSTRLTRVRSHNHLSGAERIGRPISRLLTVCSV